MKNQFLVTASLPNAGLGNMLLVWARAVVFAEINSLPMIAPNWQKIHIGPWIRREKCKRYYGTFFSARNYLPRWKAIIGRFGTSKYLHRNPDIDLVDISSPAFSKPGQYQFVFDQMPPWNDYFQGLKTHHHLVKQKLYGDIHPSILQEILAIPAPLIAIHIRRGDYKPPQKGDDFAVKRCVYTPLEWYVDVLRAMRKYAGEDLPAMIFSDAYPHELADILALPNVTLAPEASALSDMITMSRCKVLIASAHSSFSAWSSYLGQCPTIWSGERYHLYEPIFKPEVRQKVYEGGFDPLQEANLPDLLQKNIALLNQEKSLLC